MPSSQVRLLHRNPVAQAEHVVDVNTDLYGRQNCACTPFCLAPRLLPFGTFPIRDGNDHSSCSCTRLQALAPTAALIPQHPHVPFAGNHKDYNALANPGIHAQLPLHGPSIFATQPDIRVGLAFGCLRATSGDQDHKTPRNLVLFSLGLLSAARSTLKTLESWWLNVCSQPQGKREQASKPPKPVVGTWPWQRAEYGFESLAAWGLGPLELQLIRSQLRQLHAKSNRAASGRAAYSLFGHKNSRALFNTSLGSTCRPNLGRRHQ